METKDVVLRSWDDAKGLCFEANEHGIATLKAEFLAEAEEFLFLRKGEDFGGDVIGFMAAAINALSDVSLTDRMKDLIVYAVASEKIAKYYPQIRKLIDKARESYQTTPWKGRKPKDLKILLWPDETNREAQPLFERQGYMVNYYASPDKKGSHRFYLNEKRYCLFLRTEQDRFLGFIGDDETVRAGLKAVFEREWEESVLP